MEEKGLVKESNAGKRKPLARWTARDYSLVWLCWIDKLGFELLQAMIQVAHSNGGAGNELAVSLTSQHQECIRQRLVHG